MAPYLSKVRTSLDKLNKWVIKRISCTKSVQVNALAGIATTLPIKEVVLLPVYLQVASSIAVTPVCNTSETGVGWMHEIETNL